MRLRRLWAAAFALGLAAPLVATTSAGASGAPSRGVAPALRGPLPRGLSLANLTFQDSFRGSSLARAHWNPFLTSNAAGGWPWNSNGAGGSSAANPSVDFDSEYDLPSDLHVHNGLRLVALRVPTLGRLGSAAATYPWRAAALTSYGHFQLDGGYVQIDAKMPAGAGMWPGLWMLPGKGATGGDNFELDIFEGGYTGNGVSPAHNFAWHLHTPAGTAGGLTPVAANLDNSFHEYGVYWVPGQSVTWYLDGRAVGRVTSAQVPIPAEPMELIMNLQVANAKTASWHTLVGASTPSRQVMLVRSVQAYRLP